ncbi:MAG: RHS repeat-associated core domain-containing protein [Phycisphaerae bacterium]|nr:RHS repeat-associated core domain-containing protein [Phycisphaerae bacterium]MDD5380724.1 RHS repeat-associated core domain-containing protein [Phycisphaerae bacterium]
MKRADVNSYYNYDGLGSTRQLTADNEAVVASYTYDSFGSVIAQTAGGGMASNAAGGNKSINESGVLVLACFGLGAGVVAIRKRKQGLIALFIILLLTGQIPVSKAIEVDVTGNPYGFTGEQQFGEANDLIFLRARYYAPSIGRFISRDPILAPIKVWDNFFWLLPHLTGSPQKTHSYVYCSNNPVNYIDPEGMVAGIGGVIIIGGFIIIGGILAINCFSKIPKFMRKLKELKKSRDADACDTKDAWDKATKTKEFKDMIKACGIPWYMG